MQDFLTRYYFPKLGIRAAFSRLHQTQAEIFKRSAAPIQVQAWLAQFAVANALMISGIKLDGRLVLQLQSSSAMPMLFTDCTSLGQLRGIARVQEDVVVPTRFIDACAGGHLAITIEPNVGFGERYQGIVPIDPDGIAQTLEHYFEQSEQLPTRFFLAADAEFSAGLMIQSVAGAGGTTTDIPELDVDGWNRINHLAATVRPEELLALEPNQLMTRLFSEETVLELGDQSLRFHCSCSRERVGNMLLSIGHDEALAAASTGFAEVNCQFCGSHYQFDRVEIESLFQAHRLLVADTQIQ
jgi:molecular chaperone Hsp33